MSVTEKVTEKEPPLTSVRKKIFIKHIWGQFQKKRWIIFSFFLTLFYLLPWLRLNGRPPLLFDIPARKFHLLSITLWPQEVYLLTLVLITGAIGLFFSTAIVGRVWCGYLCPQTVLTSVFIEIERLVMGDSVKQKKLASQPMKGEKLVRLTIRNSIWLLIALFTGFTFLSYFVPNTEIINQIVSGQIEGWALFWLLFISAAAFLDFGFFREQFCFIPCPYGRFQGALQDPNSYIVTYDKVKGEEEVFTTTNSRGQTKEKKGACIDCNYCAIVCPTGIDIRNGSQFECISCARCIDACAVIQIKQGRTPDLIRYESENGLKGKPTKVIRPRILIYSLILFSLVSFIGYKLLFRAGFDFEITRNRNLIYQQLPDGRISNMYILKIMNMSNEEQKYLLKIKDLDAEMVIGENPVTVKSGEVYDTGVTLIMPQGKLPAKVTSFSLIMQNADSSGTKHSVEERSTFITP